MRKKILAAFLAATLCVTMSATALAVSSSSGSNSSGSSSSSGGSSGGSSSSAVTEATLGDTNTDEVSVAVVAADGTVKAVNLTQYTVQVDNAMISAAANSTAASANPGEAVSALMTTPASELFKATINVLGGKIRMVRTGGYKVVATAPDAYGNTIASLNPVKGVTKYAFIVLVGVDKDGTVEIVEGVVDPVTLNIMGVFKGTPVTVTVSVVMAEAE